MLHPPDQFQRRVYVRLPYADRYLDQRHDLKELKSELQASFKNPVLQVTITPRSLPVDDSPYKKG